MAPTSTSATPPRRQSCNRCHGQKLRCTRANNSGTSSCNRCLRQGAQCVYSSSLPKGRPSMYRLADASTATSNHPSKPHVPPTPVSPTMRRKLPKDPLPTANSNSTNINTSADDSADADADADGKVSIDNNSNLSINTNTDANTRFDINDDTTMFASPWPWVAPLNWSDMLLDGGDRDPNLHGIVDPQTDPGGPYSSGFPSFDGSTSSLNSDGDNSARERPLSPAHQSYDHSYFAGSDVFDMSSNSSLSIDRNGPEFGITQLSRLSTRLYPLYRSSCNLARIAETSYQPGDHNHSHRRPLIDDTAFKSVTSWLAHVSTNMDFLSRDDLEIPSQEPTTMGETLHNAFSASHHLLQILRSLGVDIQSGFSYSTPTVSKSTPILIESGENREFWATFTPQSLASGTSENSYFELSNGSSNYVRRPSQCYNTVVRHLVIACHTLLLNIHTTILIVLQHDADFRSPYLTPKNVEYDAYIDGTALGDIRLVVILRLCSYVINRQQQAVHLYLSPQPSLPYASENTPIFSHQPGLDASSAANRETMSDLEIEVQQRLERLRQTLHI